MSIRAGVIGLGVGMRHAAAWSAHPDCELRVLCDLAPEKLVQAKALFPDAALTQDPWQVLDDPGIDAVSVASYDDCHAAQILRGIAAGKHIFAEKPICLKDDELEGIRLALEAHPQVKFSSNLILRKCPRFVRLRRAIQAGELGRIYYLEGSYDYGRFWKLTRDWRGRQEDYSVFLGGAVHLVDLALWLTGGRVTKVSAAGNALASTGTTFRCDDFVSARLEFADGMLATINANFACVRPHFHKLCVYGTAATFENAPESARLYTSREPDRPPALWDDPYPGADKGDIIHGFADEILGRGASCVSARDALETMRVCLAVERSRRTAQPVVLDRCEAA